MNKNIISDLHYITNQNLDWEQFKNKTILISGASGFLATWIVDTLFYLNNIKEYNIKVIAVIRNLDNAEIKFSDKYYNGLTIIHRDVCDTFKISNPIDYIIHSAGNATPKVFKEDPVGTIIPNTIGTKNLLDLAKEKNAEFIYFSTSGVYGYKDYFDYPLSEHDFGKLDCTDLSSCYLESKRAGENLCIAYKHQYNVNIKIVRPCIIYGYGIGLEDGRSFADFINNIVNNQDIILYSNGTAQRSFCYISDFIVGLFTVILKGKNGEAYNIASEKEISIKELAELLVNEIVPEKNLKVVIKSSKNKNYLRSEFSRTQMNIDKLKSLGWKLNFDLKQGFSRTINSYTNK